MKKTLAIILTLVMCLGITNGVFAAGKEFSDVKPTDWFYNDVKTAVELGLVNGKGEDTYAPNDNLTYAEAIKLAACMHQIYTTGKIDIAPGNPWYVPYVDYCLTNNIISKVYDYSANATRAGYMEIFANALPGDGLKAINSVAADSIPDVPSSAPYAEGVYKLYRAGILQGVDAAHNCSPNNNIVRSEVAAILTRMMNPEKRVSFTLGEAAEPMVVTQHPIGGTLDVGGTIRTNIVVTGGVKPYKYSWEYNDGSGWKVVSDELGTVKGVTTEQISIKGSLAGSYKVRCVVKDANGSEVITDETDFTFRAKLAISKQPVSSAAPVGLPVTAKVEATGGIKPYTYRWECDAGTAWYSMVGSLESTGADSPNLYVMLSKPTTLDVRCTVTDAKGTSVTSEVVTLTVSPAKEEQKVEETVEPLLVKKQSTKITTPAGNTVSFSITLQGGKEPYTYQWFVEKDGAKVPLTDDDTYTGTTTEKLTVAKVAEPAIFYCEATDAKGTKVLSKAMQLAIKAATPAALSIETQPVDATVAVGEDAKLSVVAKGGQAPYTYQWQMNIGTGWVRLSDNDLIIGTTTSELTLKSTAASYIDVRCVVRDAAGATVESNGVRATFK